MKQKDYYILLYYCYAQIKNTEDFRQAHHIFCLKNNLRGRIVISKEGINGTVSGLEEDCLKYIKNLKADPKFKDIDFKIDNHYEHAFKKLNVRLKDEIVNSGLKDLDPNINGGKSIKPKEFQKFKEQKDVVILDVRSNYEHRQGTFKNAITFDIDNFREFPSKINKIEKYKDKNIVTVCTGNIKCEKASAYLVKKGFKNVYKLFGGIIKYGLETDGKDFEGECYVFDNRISIPINKVNSSIKNKCYVCKQPCQRMINCANSRCNIHTPICKSCSINTEGTCSQECKKSPYKRKYDGTGYYSTKTNGYNPYKSHKRKILNK
ncbi:MAG: rhodanese-related sulfurtransferase [Bacteroidetes bacterium]|nr:rhodanese-related sulfurtransferase [Bacteroidota bacterium]